MPRKGHVVKRDVLADPIYNNKVVTRLINNIMLDGKKGVAQKIVYGAFSRVEEKAGKPALEVFDEVGNTLRKDFVINVNMAPKLNTTTIPANGDTLYGNEHTSIQFKWSSYDYDSFDENKLQHTLIIDGTEYPVSRLTEIVQSGFTEGKHTFQIIVQDSFGDADTLAPRSFYILDTLGGTL